MDNLSEFSGGGGGFVVNPVIDPGTNYFDPIKVDGAIGITGTYEVASGAFGHAGKVYVFTQTWDSYQVRPRHPQGCYLISKVDPSQPGPFQEEFLFSPRRRPGGSFTADGFGGVAPVVVQNA